MISSNGYFSSHQNSIPMHNNSQKYLIHKLRRQHPSSDSKMVRCNSFLILPIIFNKQELSTIQINQIYKITTSLNLSSHQTHIPNIPKKKKTIKHYQEHLELILLKITPSPHQTIQHHMSNSLHT